MTASLHSREVGRVIILKPDRPYFDAWLRRMRRHFAASGMLSQAAVQLAAEDGGNPDAWARRLRDLLDGGEAPTIELITRVDALLAPPAAARHEVHSQGVFTI